MSLKNARKKSPSVSHGVSHGISLGVSHAVLELVAVRPVRPAAATSSCVASKALSERAAISSVNILREVERGRKEFFVSPSFPAIYGIFK